MRLSMHLILVMLIASMSTSSCLLIGGVDEVAAIQKKLQSKEWHLTRVIQNGNDVEFTPQSYNFTSETEVEYTYQPNGSTTSVTETHSFVIYTETYGDADFIIEIPDLSLQLNVISIADDTMTIGFSVNSFNSYAFLEYK